MIAPQKGGARLDIRTPLKVLSLRAGVRDFYSLDIPRFIRPVRDDRQHNIIVSGGFILKF
jgi:hypothetical protein